MGGFVDRPFSASESVKDESPAIASPPETRIDLGDYVRKDHHLLQARDGSPVTYVGWEKGFGYSSFLYVRIGKSDTAFLYQANGRRVELLGSNKEDPTDIILRPEPAIADEESKEVKPQAWNPDVVQRIKEIATPQAINDYINLRRVHSQSEVWVITTFVNESLFAGLLEAGFTRETKKESMLASGECVFRIRSLRYEEILRELVEDLSPRDGYYCGSSVANTFPRYYLLGDRPNK